MKRFDQKTSPGGTHRNLVFWQMKPDGTSLDFELIRSLQCIEWMGAEPGQTIEVDLEEFGVDGAATVLDVKPCPLLEDGPYEGRMPFASIALFLGLNSPTLRPPPCELLAFAAKRVHCADRTCFHSCKQR